MIVATQQHQYVGLDIHLRFTAVCILDANGKVIKEQVVRGHSPEVCQFLREEVAGTFDVVFEACDGYGLWHERLGRIARRVAVAHPNHLRAIWNTKRKTDRIDARKLAKLLMLNLVPVVHVPAVNIRDWRMLIQHRKSLVQKQTAIKSRLRAILRRNHVKAPKNLWSRTSRKWLASQELVAAGELLQRDMLLEDMTHVEAQILRVEVDLNARAEAHAGVVLLKTIPGVANRTAEAVVAWIDDVSRFGRTKQVGAYFGFTVCEDSSGGKQRLGHISREGPGIVRQMLVEAVWRIRRFDPLVRKWVEQVMHGQDKRRNIAVVATAHKLARCMFAMLRSGEVWNPAA